MPGEIHQTVWLMAVAVLLCAAAVDAQEEQAPARDVLSEQQWQELDDSVDRGLAWLAGQQLGDGSFRSPLDGQPAVTALVVLAFLADGHLPGEGPYGQHINRAIDYALASQRPDGMIARLDSHIVIYNHPITSLMLTEVYGMTDEATAARIAPAVSRALVFSLLQQKRPKLQAADIGGWRYLHKAPEVFQSDLSVTGWYLMSLRSARNAGFEVPVESIEEATQYVQRCFDEQQGAYGYVVGLSSSVSRGMAGAGILSMTMAGRHHTTQSRRSGDWILRHPFEPYNKNINDRYHYGVFYCTHAMLQLGGDYWRQFFPPVAATLLKHQRRNGSWPAESHREEKPYGSTYSTTLVVLALTAPYQVLPIFQK
jgi:hypothetical protein